MGVKSTTHLTRQEAEDKFVKFKQEEASRKLRSKAALLSNTELENELEHLNDENFSARYGPGGGLDNYVIDPE